MDAAGVTEKLFALALLIGSLILPYDALASEITVELLPAWWQYKEHSGKVSGFRATPLHSKASGAALRGGASVAFDLNNDWSFKTSIEGLMSVNKTTERWNLNQTMQSNRLSARQIELRLEIIRKIFAVKAGLWSSYHLHMQQRQGFIVNGVQQVTRLVDETVQSGWAGVSLEKSLPQGIHIRIEGGLPVWVHTTNDLVTGSFSRRKGFRAGVRASMQMPWSTGDISSHLIVNYQYRELGGELLSNKWLWPKNTWQELSLGVSINW